MMAKAYAGASPQPDFLEPAKHTNHAKEGVIRTYLDSSVLIHAGQGVSASATGVCGGHAVEPGTAAATNLSPPPGGVHYVRKPSKPLSKVKGLRVAEEMREATILPISLSRV